MGHVFRRATAGNQPYGLEALLVLKAGLAP
jgi:hypothetical protein